MSVLNCLTGRRRGARRRWAALLVVALFASLLASAPNQAGAQSEPEPEAPGAPVWARMRWHADGLLSVWWWPGAGPRPDGYEVTRTTDGTAHGPVAASRTNAAISGLDEAADHSVEVRATKGGSAGAATAAVWWPPAPANAAAAVSAGSHSGVADVRVSWDAVADATKYRWQWRASADVGGWTPWGGWNETTDVSAVVGDMSRNSDYEFEIEAFAPLYPGGRSEWSPKPAAVTVSVPLLASQQQQPEAVAPGAPVWARMRWHTDTMLSVWWWPGAGPHPDGYEVVRTTGGTAHDSVAATRTNAAIEGLDRAAAHSVEVRATKGGSAGPATAAVWWPPAPANAAAAVSDGSNNGVADIDLSWDPVAGAAKYRWRHRAEAEGGGWGAWGDWNETGSGTAAVTAADLARGKDHAFQIEAWAPLYPGGHSKWSAQPATTTASIPLLLVAQLQQGATGQAAPGAPVISSSYITGSGEVTLTWAAVSGATSYKYSYDVAFAGEGTAVAVSGGASATSVVISGLDASKVHTFYVYAVNDDGETRSTDTTVIPVLKRPDYLRVRAGAGSSTADVTVFWPAVTGAGSYVVIRSSEGSETEHTVNGTSHTFSSLDRTKRHGFSVKAKTAAASTWGGYVVDSLAQSGGLLEAYNASRPLPGAPTWVRAYWTSDTAMTVYWGGAANSAAGYEYTVDGGSPVSTAVTYAGVTGQTRGTLPAIIVRTKAASNNGSYLVSADSPAAVLYPPSPAGTAATEAAGNDPAAATADVTLTWDAAASGVSPAKYRHRHRKGTDAWSAWTEVDVPAGAHTTVTATIAGLDRGSTYSFQTAVQAPRWAGDTDPIWSEPAAAQLAIAAQQTGGRRQAMTDVLVSNLGASNTTGTGSRYLAVSVWAGSSTNTFENDGFDVTAVEVQFAVTSGSTTVRLRRDDGSRGAPDMSANGLLASKSATVATTGATTFTLDSSAKLEAGQLYWVTVNETVNPVGSRRSVQKTASAQSESGGDWDIGRTHLYRTVAGESWSRDNDETIKIALRGTERQRPAAPDNVAATVNDTNGQVTLSWDAVTDATSYKYETLQLVNSTTWAELAAGTGTTTTTSATFTVPVGAYIISVYATTASGTSLNSLPVTVQRPLKAPTSVRARLDKANGIVSLNWRAVTGATAYQFQTRRTGDSAWVATYPDVITARASLSAQYGVSEIRVRAIMAAGEIVSSFSGPVFVSRPLPAIANVRVGLTNRTATTAQVTLSWNAPAGIDPGDEANLAYFYRYVTDVDAANPTYSPRVRVASGTSVTIPNAFNLANDDPAFWVYTTYRGAPSQPSRTVYPSTAAPPAPNNVAVTISGTTATLTWTATADSVYRYKTPDGQSWSGSVTVTGTGTKTATITGLTSGARYIFAVHSTDTVFGYAVTSDAVTAQATVP